MRLLAVTVSLGAALLVTTAPSYAAGGDAIFKKNCASCHYTDGPAKEKTIADQLAKKGPELWYAGSKFKKDWLVAWLQNPKQIRPLKYNSLSEANKGDHPKQSAGDAAATADFLMGLTSPEVKAGVITPKESPQAKAIFGKKMPCGGCHEYPVKGEVHGGKIAAAIIFFGFNLTFFPQFVLGYLGMPRRYHAYPPEFQVLNVMSTAGASILAIGYLLPLAYLLWSLRYGAVASDHPWESPSLEWQTASPPPTENFAHTPVVTWEAYDFAAVEEV